MSLNLTVTGTGAHPFGFATLWPTGATQPTASNINWSSAGQTIANAVIVPLGTAGSVNVISGNAGTDMVLDINGYFSSVLGTPNNFFELDNNSTSYTAFFTNASTICTGACGIFMGVQSGIAGWFENDHPSQLARGIHAEVSSTGNGSAGVDGFALGTTGRSYGVQGTSNSSGDDTAGVHGVDAIGGGNLSAGRIPSGVRGDSKTNVGVGGFSQYIGVRGGVANTSGTLLAEGYLGSNFGTAADSTTGPWAVFANGTFGASGAKHFIEPHGTDAKKVIVYSSLEGREVGTYFRGTARIVNHRAVIQVPEDFRMVTDEDNLTVQVTAIGGSSQVYVESQDLNQIVINGSRDVQFHYLVQGVRRAFKNFEPVETGYEFMPQSASQTIPAYLTEEAKRRLVSNGTYNADGTVNMETAEKAGFAKIWADQAQANRAAAAAVAASKENARPH